MRITLIGYGAMGRLIRELAEQNGHEVVLTCRSPQVSVGERSSSSAAPQLTHGLPERERLAACDVAIDFTSGDAVRANVEACMAAGIPLVEGSTGWSDERAGVESIVRECNGALVFGANFSVGVNLFYRVAEFAAELFAKFPEYEAFIEEQHHSRKKDAPSGTALKLKEIISRYVDKEFSVSATRAGNIPGTHRVGFDGPADQILLEHTARSREGFAAGALMAAEWIVGKKGFYEFTDIIDKVISDTKRI
jgi:4-hydroxy-tetrahydrodipicolinate reductase